MLKEENMAEKSLVLGELKVLGNVTGNNIKTITRDISSLSQSLSTVSSKQADYFRGIADDSIITPTEKNTLKKEWSTIQNTYTAIMELAEAKQVKTTNEIQNYMTAYSNLYTYLFVTIKVFDDMTSNTSIESKDDFNSCYDTYYECETYAQNRCAAGNDYWTLRILDSLDVTGTNNEVALYNGKFYKFSASKDTWEEVNTAQYLGCKTDFPASACIDDYFLMLSDTLQRELQVTSNGVLADSDAEKIIFTWDVSEGSLYLLTESGWMSITDRNNWRYIVAQNDLIAHNYELSPALISFLEKEIPKAKKASYLGALTTPPTNYINGDWFTWASSQDTPWSGITLKKGHVYKFNAPTWTDLDPADSRNNNEFMEALNDLVDLNMGGNGYFNNLFVKKIFAMQAVINELQTKVIALSSGGCIKSSGYVKGGTGKGFQLDANGDFECNKGTFKGTVTATSGSFTGTVNASDGSFTGTVNATDGTFTGTVNANAGNFKGTITPNNIVLNVTAGNKQIFKLATTEENSSIQNYRSAGTFYSCINGTVRLVCTNPAAASIDNNLYIVKNGAVIATIAPQNTYSADVAIVEGDIYYLAADRKHSYGGYQLQIGVTELSSFLKALYYPLSD